MASSGSDHGQNVLEVSKVEGHESEEEHTKMATYGNEYQDDECSDGSNNSTGSTDDGHWSHYPGAVRGGGDADTNYDTEGSTDTIVVERPEKKTRSRAEFGARNIQQWMHDVKVSGGMVSNVEPACSNGIALMVDKELQNEKKKVAEALFHEWLGIEKDGNTQLHQPQLECPVQMDTDGGQK